MRKLWALVKKDWRLNRATVIGLLIMNAAAYGLGLAAYLWDRYTSAAATAYRPGHSAVPFDVRIGAPLNEYLRTAAVMGSIFVVLAAAVFGGAAFASERRERSAGFLAMLPVKRREIIISKLLVAFAVLAAVLAIETGVLLFSDFQREWETLPDLLMAMFNFVALGLLIFAVAWLLSTFLNSAAIAASVAIAAVGCAIVLFSIIWRNATIKQFPPEAVMWAACAYGVIFVLGGSWYYQRRVAP